MKTLKDLAGQYKTLAQTYMVQGPWRPAYKTGNLYNKVGEYNSANTMIKTDENLKHSLALSYAPPGALYGKFVENGTRFMVKRPFAEYAANDPQFRKSIEEYMGQAVDVVANDTMTQLNVSFQKLGSSNTI